ncbi:MAG: OmpA family protein [Planctomycetota bacterium]
MSSNQFKTSLARRVKGFSSAVVITALLSGCANTQMEDRITLLEQQNRTLNSDLDKARSDLAAAETDLYAVQNAKQRWDDALLTARREADDLRQQLQNVNTEPVEAAPGWTTVPGGAMISIEGNVLFQSGKTVVRPEAKRALDAVISAVNGDYASKHILVFGHTDNTPIKRSGWKDNWQLSTERALAVVRYLNEKGVAASRLAACGCGEHRPIGDNGSKANRAKNRRVEIFAIDPQT